MLNESSIFIKKRNLEQQSGELHMTVVVLRKFVLWKFIMYSIIKSAGEHGGSVHFVLRRQHINRQADQKNRDAYY